jgi:hypothetical protein
MERLFEPRLSDLPSMSSPLFGAEPKALNGAGSSFVARPHIWDKHRR